MNTEKFPKLIKSIYVIVAQLEVMFEGRPFTPDGHMVGSIGEALVAYHYGVKLYPPSSRGHDGERDGIKIEIKTTQGQQIGLRSKPEYLIVVKLEKDGSFEEIYNGPGSIVWDLVKDKNQPSNGQHKLRINRLRDLNKSIDEGQKLLSKLR